MTSSGHFSIVAAAAFGFLAVPAAGAPSDRARVLLSTCPLLAQARP